MSILTEKKKKKKAELKKRHQKHEKKNEKKKKPEFFKAIFQNISAYDAARVCFLCEERERGEGFTSEIGRWREKEGEDDELEEKMGLRFLCPQQ